MAGKAGKAGVNKNKLNGSVDLLATALRGVITEAMDDVKTDLKGDIKVLSDRMVSENALLRQGQETLLETMGEVQKKQNDTANEVSQIWKVVGSKGHAGGKSS